MSPKPYARNPKPFGVEFERFRSLGWDLRRAEAAGLISSVQTLGRKVRV